MDDQEANREQMLRRSSSSSGRLQRMDSARTLVRGSSMTFARQVSGGCELRRPQSSYMVIGLL